MAFKVPRLPANLATSAEKNRTRYAKNLPITKHSHLKVLKTIGDGSYGHVYLCNVKARSQPLVQKELKGNDSHTERLFLKEANILHSLCHPNIVKFDSVCIEKKTNLSILIEYIKFDFNPFGLDVTVFSVRDFLARLDSFDCDGFENMQCCIAKDTANGLSYLHQKDIVHRDLKPDNILVSNQHYNDGNVGKYWNTTPVVAKLTDFGESRSPLMQTESFMHSRTDNLIRGTTVYMAPEIFDQHGVSADIERLKQMDIWSYGMVVFNLLNPDLQYPYQLEINALNTSKQRSTDMFRAIHDKRRIPRHSLKYQDCRETKWSKLLDVFHKCASYSSRPTADALIANLLDCSSHARTRFTDTPGVDTEPNGSADEIPWVADLPEQEVLSSQESGGGDYQTPKRFRSALADDSDMYLSQDWETWDSDTVACKLPEAGFPDDAEKFKDQADGEIPLCTRI